MTSVCTSTPSLHDTNGERLHALDQLSSRRARALLAVEAERRGNDDRNEPH